MFKIETRKYSQIMKLAGKEGEQGHNLVSTETRADK